MHSENVSKRRVINTAGGKFRLLLASARPAQQYPGRAPQVVPAFPHIKDDDYPSCTHSHVHTSGQRSAAHSAAPPVDHTELGTQKYVSPNAEASSFWCLNWKGPYSSARICPKMTLDENKTYLPA